MSANVIGMSNALRTQFFFLGVLIGGWSTRIPEVKTELGCNLGSGVDGFYSWNPD